jgi:hypothetical protein
MTTPDVGFIDPILVEQHLVLAPASETAIQHLVTSIQGLAHPLANDGAARTELFAQHTETAYLSLGSKLMDDAGYGGAVAEKVPSFAWNGH